MVETLCFHQTGGKALPKEILRQIQSRTDGIPLFVEELSKMILESGMVEEGSNEFQLTDRMSTLSIPSTLKDSLMARLDRMSSVKDTIQTAAVLGREFSLELLKATSKKSENDLKRDLLQLEQAGMVYKKAARPSMSFAFKHALVQDAAYESLLRSRRQDLHLKVATVLENNFTSSFEQQPSILAHHQSKAGLIAKAIQNWKQASKQAKNKFAEKEAIGHLKSALQVIPSLTPGTDQNKTEFDLLLSLSSLLLNKYGFSNPEIKEVNERLVELSFELNKEEEIFISQLALVQNELGNGNLKVMDKLDNLLSVAIGKDDAFLIAACHNVIGMVNLVLGHYQVAMEHFELTLSFYKPELHEKLKSQTGGNLITQTLGNYALVLHATGLLKEAEEKIDALHTLAKKLNTLIDLSIADGLSCHFRTMQKKYPQVLDHCKSGLARFKEDDQSFFIHAMNVFNYSSLACINNDKEAAYLALESMPKYRSGFNFMNARNYIPIGEAFKAIKSPQKGLKLIDEALEIAYTVGERYFLSELYRLKGDFLFMLKKSNNEIEAAYFKSLKIAQEQSAKWWELMTAISLSNYWKSENKIKKAYELLRDAYNWFSNDIELKDLQDANSLLKEIERLLLKIKE
jgi:tetratricopeptide (TPR) repeat protein